MAGTSENGNIEQNRTICQAEKEGNESDSWKIVRFFILWWYSAAERQWQTW